MKIHIEIMLDCYRKKIRYEDELGELRHEAERGIDEKQAEIHSLKETNLRCHIDDMEKIIERIADSIP